MRAFYEQLLKDLAVRSYFNFLAFDMSVGASEVVVPGLNEVLI